MLFNRNAALRLSADSAAHYPCLSFAGLDILSGWWDISHMQATLVKADAKRRMILRGARKGAQYLVTPTRGGWWVMPAPKIKTPPRPVESPAGAWEVRAELLESFYDKSKAW
jgi:hypothetical protein